MRQVLHRALYARVLFAKNLMFFRESARENLDILSEIDIRAIVKSMQMRTLTQKTLFKVLTVLLLAGLALLLFHHHTDGNHTSDCAVCRLAAQMFGVILVAVAFMIHRTTERIHTAIPKTFSSLLLTPNLLSRAPPVRL